MSQIQSSLDRFEQLRYEAQFLQDMVDLREDTDTINTLTRALGEKGLVGLQVAIEGGGLITPGLDQEGNAALVVADNELTYGKYMGLAWVETEESVDSPGAGWKLCHYVGTGEGDRYRDTDLNLVTKEYTSHVTASDSRVHILGYEHRHSFARLRRDAFTLEIDEMILNEDKARELSDQQKLDRLYAMFGLMPEEAEGDEDKEDKEELMVQRLSYVNSLRWVQDRIVAATVVIERSPELEGQARVRTFPKSNPFIAPAKLFGFDMATSADGPESYVLSRNEKSLCVEFAGLTGRTLSAPYIPGTTKLLDVPDL